MKTLEEMTLGELHAKARALLVYNCEEPDKSDAWHKQHFREYIQPIHDEIDRKWERIIARQVEKSVEP